jgi:hypothetical protein
MGKKVFKTYPNKLYEVFNTSGWRWQLIKVFQRRKHARKFVKR